MTKPTNPNINFPEAFAVEGQKTDFLSEQIQTGFDPVDPDVLAGDNLNKFIDDTYKGLHYSMDGVNDLYKGAVLYDETETYTNKSIVFNIDENGEAAIYQSLINDNSGNALTDETKWKKVDLGNKIDLDKLNQSKALETGSVSSDADVYADVLKYKNSGIGTGIDTIKPDEYTITGTPTISNTGIATNIGNGNKIQCNTFTLADLKGKSWRVECEINVVDLNTSDTADISTYLLKFCDNWRTFGSIGCTYYLTPNKFNFRLYTRVDDYEGWDCHTTIPVLTEDIKRLKIIATFDKDAETQNYKLKVFNADTGEQLGNTGVYTPTTDKKELDIIDDLPTQSPLLGESDSSTNWTTYDLNTYKFYIEDKLVWQPCLTIPYTESKTGSKIVDAVYRDRVQDMYEQYGYAPYYTIDEENENFTLPMGEIYGMIAQNKTFDGFSLFDTKLTDRILTGDEALGWALQGSLVTMTYPDAVNRIKELYTAGTDSTYRGISCKKTTDGRYIADISQKTAIDTVYSETGIADFYILDSTNNQFYLPRNKYFMQLTDSTALLNSYNEPGLPNITGGVKVGGIGSQPIALQDATGAFTLTESGRYMTRAENSANQPSRFNLDASLSSSIYGNSETVQPPSSNKLLYYKVGHTVTNSGSIDVANVLSDINLLETNKANADLSNCTKPYVTETYVNGTSWYRLWSDGWCEQGGLLPSASSAQKVTVTFLKTFSNTNYNIFKNVAANNSDGVSYRVVSFYDKQLSQADTYATAGGSGIATWEAHGFI